MTCLSENLGREVMDAIDLVSVCQGVIKLSENPDFFSVDRVLQLSIDKLLLVVDWLEKSALSSHNNEVLL